VQALDHGSVLGWHIGYYIEDMVNNSDEFSTI